jgi:NTP pyrophosphatase (non-canonical NTP hydrolase)
MFTTNLSEQEIERLALISEECGEIQQVIGKILRHGYESVNPTIENSPTNRKMLEKEVGDLMAALEISYHNSDISFNIVSNEGNKKLDRIGKYLHFQNSIPNIIK